MPLKIDLGCGPKSLSRPEGFLGVDMCADNEPDIVADITQRIDKLKSGCAEHIHCAHVLEHLPGWTYQNVLFEMERLLMPGGTFEIRVPHPSHDDAMIFDHKHVFTPRFWRDLQERNWLHCSLVIDEIEQVPTVEWVAICDALPQKSAVIQELVELLSPVLPKYRETVVRGHKPKS